MALQLKRITWPYDCVKCDITRKLLAYGDYYYEDDEDGHGPRHRRRHRGACGFLRSRRRLPSRKRDGGRSEEVLDARAARQGRSRSSSIKSPRKPLREKLP